MDDVDRRNLADRREVMSALLVGLENPARLFAICGAASGDDDDLIAGVADAFGLSTANAKAVLDLQIRRFTPQQVRQLRDELDDVQRRLATDSASRLRG